MQYAFFNGGLISAACEYLKAFTADNFISHALKKVFVEFTPFYFKTDRFFK